MRERLLDGAQLVAGAKKACSRCKPLTGEDLMHAVSRGAAYYGLARRGRGVRIRGGVPRTYYVGIETAMPSVPGFTGPAEGARGGARSAWRKAPRSASPDREFGLVVGEPAEFRFFASAVRKNDKPGDLIEDFGEELEELPPMGVELPPPRTAPTWCRSRSKRW